MRWIIDDTNLPVSDLWEEVHWEALPGSPWGGGPQWGQPPDLQLLQEVLHQEEDFWPPHGLPQGNPPFPVRHLRHELLIQQTSVATQATLVFNAKTWFQQIQGATHPSLSVVKTLLVCPSGFNEFSDAFHPVLPIMNNDNNRLFHGASSCKSPDKDIRIHSFHHTYIYAHTCTCTCTHTHIHSLTPTHTQ